MSDDRLAPIHVVALSTLFPDNSRPNFGIFVERSLAALAAQPEVALTVIAPVGVPPWPLSRHSSYAALAKLPKREVWRGLTVHRPRFTLLPGRARRNAAAVARAVMPIISELAHGGRADVLSAQFFWPDGPAAEIVARALELPWSVKARGSDVNLWGTHSATADLVQSAARSANGVLSVSAALRDDMAAAGMSTDGVEIHYTGLDAARFRPLDRDSARAAWSVAPDQRMILSVGALTERKGQALVIEALTLLPANHIYVMAGNGPDHDTLAALAARMGMAERVRFAGPVAHDDLPQLYAAADVMVLPSASEGLANAWVEALGCGVPLVLGDIPPAHELMSGDTDGTAGRIAVRRPAPLAEAIAAVLANPPDRERLSRRTHARFDWSRHGAQLAAHLARIAGR